MTTKPENLSQYLRRRSREIQMRLLDICGPDYFQGSSKPYAAISLPWTGGMRELKAEVEDQCAEGWQ